jgi:hypothetical protein
MQDGSQHWSSRLSFYYGWLIVGIAFVTMAIGCDFAVPTSC